PHGSKFLRAQPSWRVTTTSRRALSAARRFVRRVLGGPLARPGAARRLLPRRGVSARAIDLPPRVEPAGFGDLPVLETGTDQFRQASVPLLAAACAAGPLCQVQPLGTLGATRFADVSSILRDSRTFSVRVSLVPPLPGLPPFTSLLQDDPPDH